MKWNSSVILFWLFFGISASYAQSYKISGSIHDMEGVPVIGASIKLMSSVDSSLVSGNATNEAGKFELRTSRSGNYYISISAITYKSIRSIPVLLVETHPIMQLPLIVLQPDKSIELKELVVEAKRPLIINEIDKTIINVESMAGSISNNSLEILEKTPGVMVHEDGTVSLNGKNNVQILIDGRSSYLSGQDLAAYLKSLPAAVLDKLELMDNPPAKYEATGGAIINIVLKKNRLMGYTGNLNAFINKGSTWRHSEWAHINHRGPKINWFANGGFNRGANFYNTFQNRNYFDKTQKLLSTTTIWSESDFYNNARFGRIGVDFSINPESIIGFILNLQSIPRFETNRIASNIHQITTNSISTILGFSDADFDWLNRNMNLNYQYKSKKTNAEFSADLNLLNYKSDGIQHFLNEESIVPVENDFNYNLYSDYLIYTVKADYTRPLKNKAGLELGLKSSIVSTDNDSRHFDIQDDLEELNENRSNRFLYDENINALYVSFRKANPRLSFQTGLRMENTNFKGNVVANSISGGNTFNRHFTNLFPTIFISYKMDESGNNNLGLNYSKRIMRPGFQQFNPFLNFRDNFTYSSGNQNLLPPYYHTIEISFRHRQLLNLRASYAINEGVIMQTSYRIDDNLYSKPENLGSEKIISFSANINYNPISFWLMNYNFQLYFSEYKGRTSTIDIFNKNRSSRIRLFNQFTITKSWSADLSFNYNGPEYAAQTLFKSFFYVYGGIQTKLLKDKATLKLNVEDLFFTQKRKGSFTGIPETDIYRTSEFDSRRVGLSFSYRFGNEKFLRSRKHTDNAAEQEGGRVN